MINDRQLIDEIKKLVSNSPVITGFFNGSYFIGDNNKIYDNLIIPDNRNGNGIIVYWEEKNSWLLILSGAKNIVTRQNIITNKHRRYIAPIISKGNLVILYSVIDSPILPRLNSGNHTKFYVGGNTINQTFITQFDNYVDSIPITDGVINNFNNYYYSIIFNEFNSNNIKLFNKNTIINSIFNDKYYSQYNDITQNSIHYITNNFFSKNFYYGNLTYMIPLDSIIIPYSYNSPIINYNDNHNNFSYTTNYYINSQYLDDAVLNKTYTVISKGDNNGAQYSIQNIDSSNFSFNNYVLVNNNILPLEVKVKLSSDYSYINNNFIGNYSINVIASQYLVNKYVNSNLSINYDGTGTNINNNNRVSVTNSSIVLNGEFLIVDWKNLYLTNKVDLNISGNTTYENQIININNLNSVITNKFYLNYFNNNNLIQKELNILESLILINDTLLNLSDRPSNIIFNTSYAYNIGRSIDYLSVFNNQQIYLAQTLNDDTYLLVSGIITNASYLTTTNPNNIFESITTITFNLEVQNYKILPYISFSSINGTLITNNGSVHTFFNIKRQGIFISNNKIYIDYTNFIGSNNLDPISLENIGNYSSPIINFGQSSTKKYSNNNYIEIFQYSIPYSILFLSSCSYKNNKIYISYISNDIKTKNTKYYVEVWNIDNNGNIFYSPNLIKGNAYSLNNSNANILSSSYYP